MFIHTDCGGSIVLVEEVKTKKEIVAFKEGVVYGDDDSADTDTLHATFECEKCFDEWSEFPALLGEFKETKVVIENLRREAAKALGTTLPVIEI